MSRTTEVELVDGLAGRELPGEGDAVLWIHGYTLDSGSWHELWRSLPGWRHLGVDLPGHGASRPLREDDLLPSLARSLGEAALARGCRHLAALSFGTLVALQVAIEHPTAFRSIVLGAPAVGGGPQDPEAERLYERLHRLYRERGPGDHLRAAWMDRTSPIFRGIDRGSPRWRELVERVGRHGWRELGGDAMLRLTRHRQRETALRRIETPVLVLLGEEDMAAFQRCGEIVRRAARRARRVHLSGVGHLCMLEAPERAAAVIDDHLRRHAERAPARRALNRSPS